MFKKILIPIIDEAFFKNAEFNINFKNFLDYIKNKDKKNV